MAAAVRPVRAGLGGRDRIYLVAIALIALVFGSQIAAFRPGAPPPADPQASLAVFLQVYVVLIVAALLIALVMLGYSAALLRELFGKTRISTLGLRFDATAGDLLKFVLGNLALVVLTLGLGVIVMPYRVWTFYVRHLSTVGDLDVDALLQSSLRAPIQGDGLADVFDAASF